MEIRIENVTHRYPKKEKPVLEGLKAVFPAGEIHGIFGENGTGKTTLLRLIAGLEPCQQGKVLIDGKPLTRKRIREDGITYVSSKPILFSGTVLKNAVVGLESREIKSKEALERVTPYLEKLDLWKIRNQNAKTLSSGESQKLALVRAIVLEPSVLLVDEPTGNVDTEMTGRIEELIVGLSKNQKTTVLFISHDLEQLYRIANRRWQLKDGTLQIMEGKEC